MYVIIYMRTLQKNPDCFRIKSWKYKHTATRNVFTGFY